MLLLLLIENFIRNALKFIYNIYIICEIYIFA